MNDETSEYLRKIEISAITTLELVQGRQFKNESVEIDGKKFVSCTFDGCSLVYAGGDVEFGIGCTAQNCRPMFSGAAARTVRLLQVLGLLGFDPDKEAQGRA